MTNCQRHRSDGPYKPSRPASPLAFALTAGLYRDLGNCGRLMIHVIYSPKPVVSHFLMRALCCCEAKGPLGGMTSVSKYT